MMPVGKPARISRGEHICQPQGFIYPSAWKGYFRKSTCRILDKATLYPAPMALDRPYPRSRWSVLPEVECLCSFVDASLRIGACCCILKGVDTSAGSEVTKFGTA